MARPRNNGEQQLRTWKLHRQGLGASAIISELELGFETPVSKRTVERWVAGFQTDMMGDSRLDTPIDWNRLEEFGSPGDAPAFLLSMWAYAIENALDQELSRTSEHTFCPTVRQARCWWDIHCAAPDASHVTILIMGNELATRQQLRSLGLGPSEDHDIWAFIAFQAWHDGNGKSRYDRAVKDGRIKHWAVSGRTDKETAELIKERRQ